MPKRISIKIFLYRSKSLLTLPLLLIRISNSSNIECRLSRNHLTAQYTFDGPFTILQDAELLRSLDFSFDSVTQAQNAFSGFHYPPDTSFHTDTQCVSQLPIGQTPDSHVLHTNLKDLGEAHCKRAIANSCCCRPMPKRPGKGCDRFGQGCFREPSVQQTPDNQSRHPIILHHTTSYPAWASPTSRTVLR